MTRMEVYNSIKLANNGYTHVTPGIKSHVDKLVELGKIIYIAPGYVATPDVADVARNILTNPS